jgi:hypothetical protein
LAAVAGFAAGPALAAVAGFAAGPALAAVAGFAAGPALAVVVRVAAARPTTLAAAVAFAAVAAFVVAARAVAVAAFAVAVLTVAALAEATFAVAFVAALARDAMVPAVPVAAVLAPALWRPRVGPLTPSVVWVDPERCAVPWRCAGTVLVAFVSAGRREVPRPVVRVEADPVTGSDPSTRRRSWWSELMHLTSVGGHSTCTPGERSGTHVNTT